MKPKIKKLWVEALRSGKYKQGKRALKTKNGYCCLGVLCDISNLGEWKEFSYLGEDLTLPLEVQLWAGLSTESPIAKDNLLETYNDTGYTFEEIADLIEKYL